MTEPRQLMLIVTLVATMAIAGVVGRHQRSGAVLLALTGFVWLLVDTSYEGVTLWTVSATHGLTSSDLVGLAAMLVAAIQFYRLRR